MKHKYQYVVICARSCGIQPLSQEEYDRQWSREDATWTCPECGGHAEWDDECLETNPVELMEGE